jgi:hypothetical protein
MNRINVMDDRGDRLHDSSSPVRVSNFSGGFSIICDTISAIGLHAVIYLFVKQDVRVFGDA